MRTGDPLGAKVKVVCSDCNSQWMSTLQETAKPHLVPLFKGMRWALGVNAQQAISRWAIMATMTAEYLSYDPSSIGVSQAERDFFRANQTPPPGWRVWIAPYNREANVGQWIHCSLPILDTENVPYTFKGEILFPNTQTTTFIVGKLFVHTMSSHDPANINAWDWQSALRARTLLTQIWPIRQMIIGWPTQILTDRNVVEFSRAFFDAIDSLARRHGY